MTSEMSASQLLNGWLRAGLLATQVNEYLDSLRTPTGTTSYALALRSGGEPAAEKWLNQWVRANCIRELAANVVPIARGMLTVARTPNAAGRLVHVGNPEDVLQIPGMAQSSGSQLVAVYNRPNPPGTPLPSPPVVPHFFAPDGGDDTLGLRVLTLQIKERSGRQFAELRIVFDRRSRTSEQLGCQGLTVLSIPTYGVPGAFWIQPRIRQHDVVQAVAGQSSLGDFVELGCPWPTDLQSYGINDTLGFPHALQVIANELHNLPKYLGQRADVFSSVL